MNNYDHFPADELMCKCGECDGGEMDDGFMADLVSVRKKLGIPFPVTSAYRCPAYNNQVSSTGFDGPHTTGKAVDIAAGSRLRFLILTEMHALGYTRFGIANTFIHVDGDKRKTPEVIWTY